MVRYLHLSDYNPRRIRKVDKLYGDKLNFVKRRGINEIERKKSIDISLFGCEYKEKYSLCVKKRFVKINMLIYYS